MQRFISHNQCKLVNENLPCIMKPTEKPLTHHSLSQQPYLCHQYINRSLLMFSVLLLLNTIFTTNYLIASFSLKKITAKANCQSLNNESLQLYPFDQAWCSTPLCWIYCISFRCETIHMPSRLCIAECVMSYSFSSHLTSPRSWCASSTHCF